jgi:hypothetical protein
MYTCSTNYRHLYLALTVISDRCVLLWLRYIVSSVRARECGYCHLVITLLNRNFPFILIHIPAGLNISLSFHRTVIYTPRL